MVLAGVGIGDGPQISSNNVGVCAGHGSDTTYNAILQRLYAVAKRLGLPRATPFTYAIAPGSNALRGNNRAAETSQFTQMWRYCRATILDFDSRTALSDRRPPFWVVSEGRNRRYGRVDKPDDARTLHGRTRDKNITT